MSENLPAGTYTDDEFADQIVQAYGKVSGAHLIVRPGMTYGDTWAVYEVSTGEEIFTATFDDEDLAYWFVQAHSNQPRVNDLIRSSMDEAERADRERDEIIRDIINGKRA